MGTLRTKAAWLRSRLRAPSEEARASRWLVVTLGALSGFAPLAVDMYLPAFPRIASDLGTSVSNVQLTLSLFLAGLAVGQVLWGTLSDHWGRRSPILLGCLVFAAAAIVCAVGNSVASMIVSRFLMGVGGSAGVVVSRAVVRDLFDETESARFYSMMMIIGGLAPIVAPFLGGILLTFSTWRTIFWVVAAFGLLCGGAVAFNLPETLSPQHRATGDVAAVLGRYGKLLIMPRFIVPTLAVAFTSGALFAYISGSSFVFIRFYGVSPQVYGCIFACNAGGLYGCGQMNRWLLRRFASRKILIRASVFNALAGGLLLTAALTGLGGFWVFLGLVFLCESSLALIFPNAAAVVMKPFAHQAGSASALMGTLQYAVGATSGALVGAFYNGTAIPMALLIAASSVLSCLILLLLAPRVLK